MADVFKPHSYQEFAIKDTGIAGVGTLFRHGAWQDGLQSHCHNTAAMGLLFGV